MQLCSWQGGWTFSILVRTTKNYLERGKHNCHSNKHQEHQIDSYLVALLVQYNYGIVARSMKSSITTWPRRSNWDTAGGGLLWDTAGEPLLDNVRYQQHSYSTVYYLNTVYSWQFSNDVQCKIWKVMRSGCFLARTPRQRQDNLPVSSILLIQGSVSTCISWYQN